MQQPDASKLHFLVDRCLHDFQFSLWFVSSCDDEIKKASCHHACDGSYHVIITLIFKVMIWTSIRSKQRKSSHKHFLKKIWAVYSVNFVIDK